LARSRVGVGALVARSNRIFIIGQNMVDFLDGLTGEIVTPQMSVSCYAGRFILILDAQ
jgi:hypothetical protein